MHKEYAHEVLDAPDVPDAQARRAYRDLARIHHWLGDTQFIIGAIRQNPWPVRRILDVGCATGLVSEDVGRKLGVEAFGVDLNPRRSGGASIPMIQADAVRDQLPCADVAFSMHLGHHLTENDVMGLIRNVGRSCRRFILMDLVRHAMPLALFRVFVAPFVSSIAARDGITSIRRSYTPAELRRIAAKALAGSSGTFRHSVTPFYTRQVIDISYAPGPALESQASYTV
jgi:SAM-dependent methyltransferase